jgi:hypothetical protein
MQVLDNNGCQIQLLSIGTGDLYDPNYFKTVKYQPKEMESCRELFLIMVVLQFS